MNHTSSDEPREYLRRQHVRGRNPDHLPRQERGEHVPSTMWTPRKRSATPMAKMGLARERGLTFATPLLVVATILVRSGNSGRSFPETLAGS